jgi:hypothetical protein
MKFRYIILGLDGSAPEGTDDDLLAHHIADNNEEVWVVDSQQGVLLGLMGDEDDELQEANAEDHDYEAADSVAGGDSSDEAELDLDGSASDED